MLFLSTFLFHGTSVRNSFISLCWICFLCYNQENKEGFEYDKRGNCWDVLNWTTKAPIRLIGEETGPKGDIISNLISPGAPNENVIPTAGLHNHRAPSCAQCLFANASMEWLIVLILMSHRFSYDHVGTVFATEITKVIKDSLEVKLSFYQHLGGCPRHNHSSLAEITRTTASSQPKNGVVLILDQGNSQMIHLNVILFIMKKRLGQNS